MAKELDHCGGTGANQEQSDLRCDALMRRLTPFSVAAARASVVALLAAFFSAHAIDAASAVRHKPRASGKTKPQFELPWRDFSMRRHQTAWRRPAELGLSVLPPAPRYFVVGYEVPFPLLASGYSRDSMRGEGAASSERGTSATDAVRARPILRAGLIEDKTDDLGQPIIALGGVVWSEQPIENPDVSRPVAVRAELTVKDRPVTLDFYVTGGGSAPLAIRVVVKGAGEVQIGVPRARRMGERSGEPLDMVGQRKDQTTTVFVPSSEQQARANIARQLVSADWLDVPVRPASGDAFTLTFEKGRSGLELLQGAFAEAKSP